jgi:hypothetical protein
VKDQRTLTGVEWARQGRAQEANVDRRELRQLWRLFRTGAALDDGLGVDQVGHALMVAEQARRAGWVGDLLAAALLHDVAKPLSLVNHPAVAAEILRDRLSLLACDLVRYHSAFLGELIHGRHCSWARSSPARILPGVSWMMTDCRGWASIGRLGRRRDRPGHAADVRG